MELGNGFSGGPGGASHLGIPWRERAWVWGFAPSSLPRIPTERREWHEGREGKWVFGRTWKRLKSRDSVAGTRVGLGIRAFEFAAHSNGSI